MSPIDKVEQILRRIQQARAGTGGHIRVGIVNRTVLDGFQILPSLAGHDFLHGLLALAVICRGGHDVVRVARKHLLLRDLGPAAHVGEGVGQTHDLRQLVQEGIRAAGPQAPLQGRNLEVHGLSGILSLFPERVKALLHLGRECGSLFLLARQLAQHGDGIIHARQVLRIGNDNPHTGCLQRFHLLDRLGHFAHDDHIGLQRQNLFNIGLRAAVDAGQFQHGFGIVAVFAAAHQHLFRAKSVKNFAVGGIEGDHAGSGCIQRDFTACHVGQREALCQRGRGGQRKHERRDQGQDLSGFHGFDSSFVFLHK